MSRLARILVGLLLLFLAAGALFFGTGRAHPPAAAWRMPNRHGGRWPLKPGCWMRRNRCACSTCKSATFSIFPKNMFGRSLSAIRRLSLFAGQGICLTRLEAQPENQSCRLLFEIQVRDASQARRSRSLAPLFSEIERVGRGAAGCLQHRGFLRPARFIT